jgi:hypothetical protein
VYLIGCTIGIYYDARTSINFLTCVITNNTDYYNVIPCNLDIATECSSNQLPEYKAL